MNSRMRPLLVVDAANVMGSVPDGWWLDRSAGAERVRDALGSIAAEGRAGLPAEPPLDVVLVTEGAARGVESTPQVRVVPAAGTGDDAIVDLVRTADPGRRRIVVTADRGLRSRVRDLGAEVVGPRTVYP